MDSELTGMRNCSHPGCDWPAVASMGFDYESRLAWLEDLSVDPWRNRYVLCGLHAQKFKAPVGWSLEDRRGIPEPQVTIRPTVKVEAGRELATETAAPRDDLVSARIDDQTAGATPLFDL